MSAEVSPSESSLFEAFYETSSDSSDSFPEEHNENNLFGLDDDTIKTHLNSINQSLSFHRKQLCLPKKESINFNNEAEAMEDCLRKSTDLALLHEYQLVINDLEKKISCLKLENDSLKDEIKEQINKTQIIQHQNQSLLQRIDSIEEQNVNLETKFNELFEAETEKHRILVEKIQISHREFRDTYLDEVKYLEAQLEDYKNKNQAYNLQLKDLNKQIKDLSEHREELNVQLVEKEQTLLKEITKNAENQTQLIFKIQLEKENELLKQEIESLNSGLEILSSKIKNSNYGDEDDEDDTNSLFSRLNYLNISSEPQSVKNMIPFNTELNCDTSEELIKKFKREKQNSSNLQDYVEKIQKKIMLNYPNLFESKLKQAFKDLNEKLALVETPFRKHIFDEEINSLCDRDISSPTPTEMNLKKLIDSAACEQQKSQCLKDFIDELLPTVLEDCPRIFEITKSSCFD